MCASKADWKTNETLAMGKGATVQEFTASAGGAKLEIDVAPWGEGHLKINGREVAHVTDAKDRRQAFQKLKDIADRFLDGKPINAALPAVKAKLLEGKKASSSASPTRTRLPGVVPRPSGHSERKSQLPISTRKPKNLSCRWPKFWRLRS